MCSAFRRRPEHQRPSVLCVPYSHFQPPRKPPRPLRSLRPLFALLATTCITSVSPYLQATKVTFKYCFRYWEIGSFGDQEVEHVIFILIVSEPPFLQKTTLRVLHVSPKATALVTNHPSVLCWILFPAEAAEPQRIKPQKLFVLFRVFRGSK